MAVYKVIQDIEAEDKLLGPLTLKGFIYALSAGGLAFLNFKILVSSSLGNFRWLLLLLFGLPMLLFAVLASPLGREQPTEIWLLSRVRFFVKPRRRVWDQSGISNLVTITVPKKIERHLTKELSQSDVQSRLQTLAMTMDSRGWAVKNVNVNLNPVPGYLQAEGDSDRLVSASSVPQQAPIVDVNAADDILDEQNNPTAQKFEDLVQQKDAARKKENLDKMSAVRADGAPMQPPKQAKKGHSAYHVTEDKAELNKKFAAAEASFQSRHSKPNAPLQTQVKSQPEPPVTAESQAAKLELAQSGNAFSVATLQKLANHQAKVKQLGPYEVEISLH